MASESPLLLLSLNIPLAKGLLWEEPVGPEIANAIGGKKATNYELDLHLKNFINEGQKEIL